MPQEKIDLTEFFEEQKVDAGPVTAKRTVKIAVKPMTKEQARQAYSYRPFSKYAETRWGGNTLVDDVCLVINGQARRCKMCQAPTKNQFLANGVCSDCDGRAEYSGYNPHRQN